MAEAHRLLSDVTVEFRCTFAFKTMLFCSSCLVGAEAVTASFFKILQLANHVILAKMSAKISVNSMLNKLKIKPNRSKPLAGTSLLLKVMDVALGQEGS